MNVKAISRNVGYALLVSALFMLLSIFVSLSGGNDSALAALIISFMITFTVGIFPFIFVRKTTEVTLKDGYMIIVLSWLLSFIFGMLPYALWGGPFTLANAWFESVSGFTTTGATILDDVEALPKSLLFWRSSTHFIGGLGVVVFLLLIIPDSSPMRLRLANMELSSMSKDGYNTRANKVVYIFAYVYLAIGALAFICYLLAGMSAFDAICHAMSVCATGGFSTRNLSIGAFDSRLIEGMTMIFMLLSSVHFGMLYMAVVRRSLRPFDNPVLKFYLGAIAVFSVFLAVVLHMDGIVSGFGTSLWNGAFHTICIASTTGFATMDNSGWPMLANMVLVFMGIMCGCAGSTSGGLKADRVLLLIKSVGRQISRILHPSSVNEVRFGSHIVHDDEVSPHLLYIALYGVIMLLSVIFTLACGLGASDAFTGSLASLGNVGPAVGDLGTYGSFNAIPGTAKFIFTMDMFLGRIEIYPVLAVLAMIFSSNRK